MDLDVIGGLDEIRPAVYRAALKLQSLQKLCHMNVVTVQRLHLVLCAVGDSGDPAVGLSLGDLRQSLEQLFLGVSQELPEQQVTEASEQTASLLFKLYDREETGSVLLRSVEAALVVLSGDSLTAKHRALFQLAARCSRGRGMEDGSVSCAGLRVMLDDLSQVPAAVQENHVFGHVETAVRACFNGEPVASVGEEHIINWLQSEPRLLLWLSTLYRLSVSEDVQHRVHCHVCKAFPITGLRYRCRKCLNVHLCQTCFLTDRRTRKHKPSHPVLEYCTQPSWKESMSSLASSARHTLLARRYTRELERSRALREMERSRAIRSESNGHSWHSAPAPLQQCDDSSGGLFALPPSPPPPPAQIKGESKALQTDEPDTQPQRKMSLLQKDLSITQKAMRDLQRDEWLLKRELQVWRTAAQSEQDSLEERCAELESTVGVLIQQNKQLEEELGQVRHVLSVRGRNKSGSFQQPIHIPPTQQGDPETEGPSTCNRTDPSSVCETLKGELEREEDKKEERKWEKDEKNEENDKPLDLVQERCHTDGGHSGHTDGGHSSHTDGSHSSHKDGGHSGHTDGGHSGHTDGGHSSHTDGGHSGHTDGGHSGHTDGGHSGHTDGSHSGHTDGGHSSHTDGSHSGHTDGGHSSHTDGGHSGHTDGGHSGHTDRSHSGHTDGGHSSHTDGGRHKGVVVADHFATHIEGVQLSEGDGLEEEEVPGLNRQEFITDDSCSEGSIQEDCGPGNSDEQKEQELCDLVQHLKVVLLQPSPTGSGSSQREALLQAAGEIGDSVFQLVTCVRSITWSS